MEKFRLEKPNCGHRERAIKFIQEFHEHQSPINGTGGLHRFLNDYDGWLQKLETDRNVQPSEQRVPTETFFFVRDDNRIIGMINIRLSLNESLRKQNGNIGYCIRPTERTKGYNKINLYLGLLECQRHGLKKVMLDCDKDNLASSKTIQSLCGNIEREYYNNDSQTVVEVYWINVDSAVDNNLVLYKPFLDDKEDTWTI